MLKTHTALKQILLLGLGILILQGCNPAATVTSAITEQIDKQKSGSKKLKIRKIANEPIDPVELAPEDPPIEEDPALPIYLITYQQKPGGAVLINGELCSSTCNKKFTKGEKINITPLPSMGYSFSKFNNICIGFASCDFIVTGNTIFSIDFITDTPSSPIVKKFAWGKSERADGYKIYFGSSTGNYNGDCIQDVTSPLTIPNDSLVDSANPTLSLTFKDRSRVCYLKISAYGPAGESDLSAEIAYNP